MRPSPEIRYDVASALSQGKRDYQEDTVIADFPLGSDVGFVVLSDGMGGHSAGDIASKIIVTEVFSELKLQHGDTKQFAENVSDILLEATMAANDCIKGHVGLNPETEGMGATLVAPVIIRDLLFWISVGDSPLYLFREGDLTQLNEDHSMAPQIDLMVSSGLMDAEDGKYHPDRNCLTSVIVGTDIAQIDCPKAPMKLRDGDILIAASDGLQFLTNDNIKYLLAANVGSNSNTLADVLLHALEELGDPDQDNISFSVIKVQHVRKPVEKLRPRTTASSNVRVDQIIRTRNEDPAIVSSSSAPSPLGYLRRVLIPGGNT